MSKELLYYIEGLDESILKLNDYIDSDLEFIKYTSEDFEKKYRRRFRNLISDSHPLGF